MSIQSLEESSNSASVFTLKCTSTGSPATTVIWRKDGTVLTESSIYHMTQTLHNGFAATYMNYLEVNAGPYAVVGNYSCTVSNILGYDTQNVIYEGMTRVFQ